MTQPRRRSATVRDMALSIGVTLLFVLVLVAVTHRGHGTGVPTVPWRAIAAQAKPPLVAPADLPVGWRATSARLVSAGRRGLHIGTLTTAGRYVALEESATTAPAYLSSVLPTSVAKGSQEVAGGAWARRQSTDSEDHVTRALTRQDGGVTYVVVGTGSWAELAALISAARF